MIHDENVRIVPQRQRLRPRLSSAPRCGDLQRAGMAERNVYRPVKRSPATSVARQTSNTAFKDLECEEILV